MARTSTRWTASSGRRWRCRQSFLVCSRGTVHLDAVLLGHTSAALQPLSAPPYVQKMNSFEIYFHGMRRHVDSHAEVGPAVVGCADENPGRETRPPGQQTRDLCANGRRCRCSHDRWSFRSQDAVRGDFNDLAKLFIDQGAKICADGKVRSNRQTVHAALCCCPHGLELAPACMLPTCKLVARAGAHVPAAASTARNSESPPLKYAVREPNVYACLSRSWCRWTSRRWRARA